MRTQNCENCGLRLKGKKFDYSQGGCIHTEMEGFICLAFAFEGYAIWMVGIGDDGFCEMYTPRSADE